MFVFRFNLKETVNNYCSLSSKQLQGRVILILALMVVYVTVKGPVYHVCAPMVIVEKRAKSVSVLVLFALAFSCHP